MSVRRAGSALAVATGLLLAVVGAASACSPQASILAVGPPSGPAGSVLALKGIATAPGAPVEIRWNAVRGPVLGTAVSDPAGNYVASATLPEARPGIYTIIAVSREKPVARLAVELTPSPGAPVVALSGARGLADATRVHSTGSSFDLGLAVGAGLLGLGLIIAMSAAGVVAVGRRRVTVERPR